MVRRYYGLVDNDTGASATVSSHPEISPAILELLGCLKLSLAQVRLYPKDSPQVSKVGDAVFQSLSACLDQDPKFILAAAPNGLLINGQRLGGKDFATVTVESSLISFFL